MGKLTNKIFEDFFDEFNDEDIVQTPDISELNKVTYDLFNIIVMKFSMKDTCNREYENTMKKINDFVNKLKTFLKMTTLSHVSDITIWTGKFSNSILQVTTRKGSKVLDNSLDINVYHHIDDISKDDFRFLMSGTISFGITGRMKPAELELMNKLIFNNELVSYMETYDGIDSDDVNDYKTINKGSKGHIIHTQTSLEYHGYGRENLESDYNLDAMNIYCVHNKILPYIKRKKYSLNVFLNNNDIFANNYLGIGLLKEPLKLDSAEYVSYQLIPVVSTCMLPKFDFRMTSSGVFKTENLGRYVKQSQFDDEYFCKELANEISHFTGKVDIFHVMGKNNDSRRLLLTDMTETVNVNGTDFLYVVAISLKLYMKNLNEIDNFIKQLKQNII